MDPALAALPVWPSTLRTGMPSGESLWPFDAELIGLRRGRRQIVKREAFDDEAEAADRAWLEAAGVTVVRVGPIDPDGRRVSLGAFDVRALDEAVRDAEVTLRASGAAGATAARVLGEALGYPRCCIDAFAAAPRRDDASLVAARLTPSDRAPSTPLTQWLDQPLALVSHVPCDLDCAATAALAADLLDGLEHAAPGFATRWRALAARLHVIDRDGRNLALAGAGSLARGFTIEHAVAFAAPRDGRALAADAPALAGRRLGIEDVVAAADHRG